MERQSISLIGFSVFFGILVGFSILLSTFYASGVFNDKSPTAQKALSGMDVLKNYSCQKAETKQIIVGGVEDNFDPSGEELSNPSEKLLRYLIGLETGRTETDVSKTYDERRVDSAFSDRFDVPKRTFSGLIVVRVEELSNLRNDGITIGFKPKENFPYINIGYGYRIDISELPRAATWQGHDTLYYASLKDLEFLDPEDEELSVLDIIRTRSANDGDFFVEIADDTVVDFVGFALCLEPEDDLGTVFSRTHAVQLEGTSDLGPGIIGLHHGRVDGEFCGYSGCLSCEIERPVACIEDFNMPLPDGHDQYYSPLWTGGNFKFTRAVKGSSFSTEDDVDQFCAAEFGPEWRALSRHDGHSGGSVAGKGIFPSDYENVWVNVKDSDHHNCWTTRPDYEASNGG